MNTTPLTPDEIDTLLSGELDGEFELAASDLDLSAAEARDRLAETPGIDVRRRALMRARDLIATPPPLSSTLEDRLMAAAMAPDELAAARQRRRRNDRARRTLIAVGSVAAVIAVVVGIANLHSPDSAKSSAGAARTGPSASGAKAARSPGGTDSYVDFGDVTRGAGLQSEARRVFAERKSGAGEVAAPEATTAATPPAAANGDTGPSGVSADKAQAAPAPATFGVAARSCTAAVRQRYGISSEPAIVGTGRVSGAPVVVLVFERGGGAVAYIVRPEACTLVRKQPLG